MDLFEKYNESQKQLDLFGRKYNDRFKSTIRIKKNDFNGYLWLEIDGYHDVYNSGLMINTLNQSIDKINTKIILDLERVEFVSSSFIPILIQNARYAKKKNGNLIVFGVDENHKIFDSARVMGLLDWFHFSLDINIDIKNNTSFLKNLN